MTSLATRSADDGASPTVGVIVLVAIAVGLVAIASAFVFGIHQPQSTQSAGTTFDQPIPAETNVMLDSTQSADSVVVVSPLGTEYTVENPGDTATVLNVESRDDIRVLGVADGDRTLLQSQSPTGFTANATVDKHGTEEYSGIQAAVDNASSGDVIAIEKATYTENVDVDKNVTLVAEHGTVIRDRNPERAVFDVSGENVTLANFHIDADPAPDDGHYSENGVYASGDGIRLINNTIINATTTTTSSSLYLAGERATLSQNTLQDSTRALTIDGGAGTHYVSGNTFSANTDYVVNTQSTDATVGGNDWGDATDPLTHVSGAVTVGRETESVDGTRILANGVLDSQPGSDTKEDTTSGVLLDHTFEDSMHGWTTNTGEHERRSGHLTSTCSDTANTKQYTRTVTPESVDAVHVTASGVALDSWDGEAVKLQVKDETGWRTVDSMTAHFKDGTSNRAFDCSGTDTEWTGESYSLSGTVDLTGDFAGVRVVGAKDSEDSDESLAIDEVTVEATTVNTLVDDHFTTGTADWTTNTGEHVVRGNHLTSSCTKDVNTDTYTKTGIDADVDAVQIDASGVALDSWDGESVKLQVKDANGWRTVSQTNINSNGGSNRAFDCDGTKSGWTGKAYSFSTTTSIEGQFHGVRLVAGKDQNDWDESLSIDSVSVTEVKMDVFVQNDFTESAADWTSDTGQKTLKSGWLVPGCSKSTSTKQFTTSFESPSADRVHYDATIAAVDSWDDGESIKVQFKDDDGWKTVETLTDTNYLGSHSSAYDCHSSNNWAERTFTVSGEVDVTGDLTEMRVVGTHDSVDDDESIGIGSVTLYTKSA